MKATQYADDTCAFRHSERMHYFVKGDDDESDNEQGEKVESDRNRKKRELNRLAAQRSREKRRQLIKQLEEEVKELERCNGSLKTDIANMHEEISQLDYLLQNHTCSMMQ